MELSVIIPVFNEEKNLPVLIRRLNDTLSGLKIGEYELLLINDGSRDGSLPLIQDLAKGDNRINYISFSRNFGHQVAVSAGLNNAKGDYILIIDADLQDPPELIADLYKKAKEGYDVVYARRLKREGETFFKKITARLFYRFLKWITSIDIPLDTGDFRIISRRVARVVNSMPEKNKFIRGQIAWAGFRQTYIEYEREARNDGETGYSIGKMARLAMDAIAGFSDVPLRFATLLGFVVSGVAFIIMLYALYGRFISKDYVEGWTSLILSTMFIGGVILICIGIIGEYMSRIFENILNRPLYIIEETNIEEAK